MSNPRQKTALITGVRGQDGFYLAELLRSLDYRVIGTSHSPADQCGSPALADELIHLDLAMTADVHAVIDRFRPDEVYNLAARSSSTQLFDDALATAEINGLAATRFLEAIRRTSPSTRYFQAASSEIFVGTDTSPQEERTPLRPLNAYGAAKAYALHIVTAYRERYGLHASTGILFNHESPRRGEEYVTRKISRTVARIATGQAEKLMLGDLESRRDWGYAADYVQAMWRMLQQEKAADYIIATGETHSVREFCETAFAHVGLDYRKHVETDPSFARRAETVELRGNSSRARMLLGWEPRVSFVDLVRMMVDADLAQLREVKPGLR